MNKDVADEKEFYRNRIVKMVKEMESAEYLEKIFYYIEVPYKKEKEKG